MRIVLTSLLLLAPCLLAAATPASGSAAAPRCDTREPSYDSREVDCRFAQRAVAARYRFEARFSGGHDDTMASLSATMDGKPLVCEAGSKLRLMGEDGEVSLICLFTLERMPMPAAFLATVTWSHAQYEGHTLSAM